MILQSLAGLPAFLVYFCTALVAVVAYLFVYTRVTPHDEFQLIRENDPAAAIALGLSLLGFVLPVVSAIAHSANVWDCLIWSVASPSLLQSNTECQPRGSSSGGGSGGGRSYYSSGSSSSQSVSGTSDSGSSHVTRGGFGSFAHAFGFSGG